MAQESFSMHGISNTNVRTATTHDARKEIIPTHAGFTKLPDAEIAGLPRLHSGWAIRDFEFSGTRLKLTLPCQPDTLLDDPNLQTASRDDDYMPYWGYLWPIAIPMAEAVLKAGWPAGTRVLELGCGVGLVSLAALAAGCHVTMSDYEPQALSVAAFNARRNDLQHFETARLDWRTPPSATYPVILGCDLLYEERNLVPILNLLDVMLESSGTCWLADGGRPHTAAFVSLAQHRGFEVEIHNLHSEVDGLPMSHGQLFVLSRL
jgi:predicted nicotinamide N-methyase